ncbi:MAG: hypothetical protein RIR11_2353 [Bacteroidota bacterium]|jgi:hypothetical protein
MRKLTLQCTQRFVFFVVENLHGTRLFLSKSHLKLLQKTLHLCLETRSIGIQKIHFHR